MDSNWVNINDLGILVGKNESGKTSIMRALHKFNPFQNESYSIEREWPRNNNDKKDPTSVVVSTIFEFSLSEKEKLKSMESIRTIPDHIKIEKTYSGKYIYSFPEELSGSVNSVDSIPRNLDRLKLQFGKSIIASAALKNASEKVFKEIIDLFNKDMISQYPTFHNGYINLLDNSAQKNEKDRVVLANLKKSLKLLLIEINSKQALLQAIPVIEKWIPTFIYIDDYQIFTGTAKLKDIKMRKDQNRLTSEDKTTLMIFGMAGLDIEKEIKRETENSPQQRMLDLADASSKFTKLIEGRWSQKKYEVDFRIDGDFFATFVKGINDKALIPLEERSKGFQWFFSFDLTLMHETRGTFKDSILLLDEPGLHLHAAAQRDLLNRFKAYSHHNQLIYTTHMPFMIDMDRLDSIHICEETDKGTIVTSNLYSNDLDARLPLQTALGLSLSQSLFVGNYNLIVEGVTDFWLISAFSTILRNENKMALDDRIVIIPAGGAMKVSYLATMLNSQKLKVVVLFDSDQEGWKGAKETIQQWILKDKYVLLLGKVIGKEEACLEDLFPANFYLEFVNKAYVNELSSSPITETEISKIGNPQIVKRIESAMQSRGLPKNNEGLCFNKGRVSKKLLEELSSRKFDTIPADTIDKFEMLFKEINNAMMMEASTKSNSTRPKTTVKGS